MNHRIRRAAAVARLGSIWRSSKLTTLVVAGCVLAFVVSCTPLPSLLNQQCPALPVLARPPQVVDVWVWSDANAAGAIRAGRVQWTPDKYIHVRVGDTVVWHSSVGSSVTVDLKGSTAPFSQALLPISSWGNQGYAVSGGTGGCYESDLVRNLIFAAGPGPGTVSVSDSTRKVPNPGPVVVVDY